MANTARGGGLESGEGYNIKINFLNIDNIHAMRHSLFKVKMKEKEGEEKRKEKEKREGKREKK